ncbi:MAG: deoxyribodipyrimidine photo-lyase, partial [Haloplanus sp.]
MAGRDDPVVPVYVYDPEALGTVGKRQRAFFMRGVRALKKRYRELGSDLLVRSGTPSDVLTDLAEEFGVDTVGYAEGYRPARRTRQRSVDRALGATGTDTESWTDLVLVNPGRLDAAYPNHSQFYDDWQRVPKSPPAGEPAPESLADVSDGTTVPVPEIDIDLPGAGYAAARERYDDFLDAGIYSYNDTRDDLALAVDAPTAAVSRLSPYLAAGMIGVREVWADATD